MTASVSQLALMAIAYGALFGGGAALAMRWTRRGTLVIGGYVLCAFSAAIALRAFGVEAFVVRAALVLVAMIAMTIVLFAYVLLDSARQPRPDAPTASSSRVPWWGPVIVALSVVVLSVFAAVL
jgi:hypothetical protein